MPQRKISQLTEATALTETDIAAFLANPSSVPVLKQIGLRSLFKSVEHLTAGSMTREDHVLLGRTAGSGGAVKVLTGDLIDLLDLYMARIPVDHKWGLWLYSGTGNNTGNQDVVGTVDVTSDTDFWTDFQDQGYVEMNGNSPFGLSSSITAPAGSLWMGRNPNLRGWVGPRNATLDTLVFGLVEGIVGLAGSSGTPTSVTFAAFRYQTSRGQTTWWCEHNVAGSTPTTASTGFSYAPGVMRYAEIVVRDDGLAVDFYLDGTLVYTATDNIPPPNTALSAGLYAESNSTGGLRAGMVFVREDPLVPPTPNETAYEYYRIEIQDNNGDTSFTGIVEFELFEEIGGTNYALASNGGVATASIEDATLTASLAIDGLITTGNGWAANNVDVWPQWLQVQLSTPRVIRYYNVGSYATTTSAAARSAKDWIMYGSNNGTDWTELSRVYNSTAWLFGVRRLYTM